MSTHWQSRAVCPPAMAWLFTTETKPNPHTIIQLAEHCNHCPVFTECAGMGAKSTGCGFFAGVYLPDRGTSRLTARDELARRAI